MRKTLLIATLVVTILLVVFLILTGVIGGETGNTSDAGGATERELPACSESFFGGDACVVGTELDVSPVASSWSAGPAQ